MPAPTLEECSAFLQQPNKASNGSTVFGHVSEILLKLVEERPPNPVDAFEEVATTTPSCTLPPCRAFDRDRRKRLSLALGC